eukprot:14945439-Ditylum_brightwellii.AAC.1
MNYKTFVAIHRNKNEGLQDTIIALRKQERVILTSRKARGILRNRVKRSRDKYEEEDKEEEKRPTKIQGNSRQMKLCQCS